MPDRNGMNPPHTLADALRALPDAAPQADVWPQLAQALAQRRRARRWRIALPIALAAGVMLALLLPRVVERETPASMPVAATPARDDSASNVATTTKPATTEEIDALRRRSHSLETWIAAVSAQAPQDGRDLMAAVEVEDLIGVVDVQLDAARNDAEALPLWQRRVDLLEDLATIRSAAALSIKGDARVAATQIL